MLCFIIISGLCLYIMTMALEPVTLIKYPKYIPSIVHKFESGEHMIGILLLCGISNITVLSYSSHI